MARGLNSLTVAVLLLVSGACMSQRDSTYGVKPPVYNDYKTDSSFTDFRKRRIDVAKAQINRLKNGGALLVRLKTNQKAIDDLKAAGNVDLATHVERETQMTNKKIIKAYQKEFTFCPVYFFLSQYSDSVKHQHLEGIFTDTLLVPNPSIVCHASFYLVAEQNMVYDSSLGIVSLKDAPHARENGTATKEAAVVVKNRFFIQLHDPFPFYQKGYNLKKFGNYIRSFNESLQKFYEASIGSSLPAFLSEYVY